MSDRPVPADGVEPVLAMGIDIGGSGIKGAAVDLATGAFATPRHRIPTPQPSGPVSVLPAVRHLADLIDRDAGGVRLPVGITFPAPIIDGRTMMAANVDQDWVAYPAETALSNAVGSAVVLLNDADAAGIAEMRYGAGRGQKGTVIVLTLGTGVGSALFIDGRLVPNIELGHLEIRGKDAEKRSSAAQRTIRRLSWADWTALLDEHLRAIERLFWPDLMILGGGVSKNGGRFIPLLTVRCRVVPAELKGDAGIVGAALVAAPPSARRSVVSRARPAVG
jgi:polyphosphate glucokinase